MKRYKVLVSMLMVISMIVVFCVPAFAADYDMCKANQFARLINNDEILKSIEESDDDIICVENISRIEDDLVEFSKTTLLETKSEDGIIENDYVKEAIVIADPNAYGQISDNAQDGAYTVHLYVTLYYTTQNSNNFTYYKITNASGRYTKANDNGTAISSQSNTLIQTGQKITGGTTTSQKRTVTLSVSKTSWADYPPSSWEATGVGAGLAMAGCEYKMTLKRVSTGYTWSVSVPVFALATQ
jgi:hypothetical protein